VIIMAKIKMLKLAKFAISNMLMLPMIALFLKYFKIKGTVRPSEFETSEKRHFYTMSLLFLYKILINLNICYKNML